ncbi:hypothetical protein [Chryseobacterium culicis]|uniref:hypothetical protein n=1 Tax=Chryseobacterium culicis TaxID=680127 RepID=UPI00289B5A38|nr:hypothetical protein [Chryseobacterium culicis]
MKNLRLTLGFAALAIGSFAAFSFAPASSNAKEDAVADFYVNADGSMGSPVGSTNLCQPTRPNLCSQEYNTETGEPTGNHIKNGIRQ